MESENPGGKTLLGAVAVVTGAAQGIGQAIAVALADAGARVVLGGRSLERLHDTLGMASDRGNADALVLDVADPDSITQAAAEVEKRYGATTILVNSAGYSITKSALDVTVAEWDAVHDVQLRGTFLTCQAFARSMQVAGYGKIVNVSSTWAATVAPGRSVYCAAKAGVGHLTAALGTEWAPLGIRVNAIGPTATETPTIAARFRADPSREEYLRSRIPMGRLATPSDMVGAALFLASPSSDFVTGQTLYVDGGWVGSK